MLVKVLKPFPYHADVRTVLALAAGDVVEIQDDLVEGLEAEGFIDEATAEDVEASRSGAVVIDDPVEIPADWRAFKWFQIVAIARKLGAPSNVNKAVAIATIEAELAARGEG